MSEESAAKQVETKVLYDADAVQQFKYSIPVADKSIDGVIKFHPFQDARYLVFLAEATHFNSDNEIENVKKAWEANQKLWEDLRLSGEFEGLTDWEDYLEYEDISAILGHLTVVVIKSVTKNPDKTMTVVTECYFNGVPCEQTHHLKTKTIDSSSKFSLLESKQFIREEGKGLDAKPTIKINPQDQGKADIYNEMLIETTGFSSWIPLRFKTLVIDRIHSSKVKPKK